MLLLFLRPFPNLGAQVHPFIHFCQGTSEKVIRAIFEKTLQSDVPATFTKQGETKLKEVAERGGELEDLREGIESKCFTNIKVKVLKN